MNDANDAIEVRRASETGVAAFAALLAEAAQRMIRQNTPMWQPEALTEEKLLAQYSAEEMHVGYCNGQPAFSCALQERDDTFWGENSGYEDALYIHKIAVADTYTGQGMVYKMFAYAADEARRRGKTKLRLDCRIDRMKVRAIYDAYGFRVVAEKRLFGWYHGVAYEYVLPGVE